MWSRKERDNTFQELEHIIKGPGVKEKIKRGD